MSYFAWLKKIHKCSCGELIGINTFGPTNDEDGICSSVVDSEVIFQKLLKR